MHDDVSALLSAIGRMIHEFCSGALLSSWEFIVIFIVARIPVVKFGGALAGGGIAIGSPGGIALTAVGAGCVTLGVAWIASIIAAIVLVGRGRRRTEANTIAKEVVLGFTIVGNAFRGHANKRHVLQLAGTVGVAISISKC